MKLLESFGANVSHSGAWESVDHYSNGRSTNARSNFLCFGYF